MKVKHITQKKTTCHTQCKALYVAGGVNMKSNFCWLTHRTRKVTQYPTYKEKNFFKA
jgi:hypothetical protein